MSKKASEDALALLHSAVAKHMAGRLASVDDENPLPASELAVIVKFLKDNNINADLSDPNIGRSVAGSILNNIPDFDEDGDEFGVHH